MAAQRYEALDSWRGICACMVALYHFEVMSHISLLPLVRNAYLFVDFFFVLSGFVIAANYRTRLIEGFGTVRFMALRFGRIYPLHFVMLLVFIPIDAAKDGADHLVRPIVTNLLLLQGLGFNDRLALDFPGWSISAEFAAYVVFAAIVVRAGRRTWPWLAMIVAGPIVLSLYSPNGMNATYDFGLVRCLYGFALGVVCFELRSRMAILDRPSGWDTLIEIASAALMVSYVWFSSFDPVLSIASPVVFAAILLVFAREGGAVSRAMRSRPLLVIGTLSYSIYMVHAFVRAMTRAVAMVAHQVFGWDLLVPFVLDPKAPPDRVLSIQGSYLLGDLLQIAMILGTIALAFLTYRFVEKPGRDWSRRLAARHGSSSGSLPIASRDAGV